MAAGAPAGLLRSLAESTGARHGGGILTAVAVVAMTVAVIAEFADRRSRRRRGK